MFGSVRITHGSTAHAVTSNFSIYCTANSLALEHGIHQTAFFASSNGHTSCSLRHPSHAKDTDKTMPEKFKSE